MILSRFFVCLLRILFLREENSTSETFAFILSIDGVGRVARIRFFLKRCSDEDSWRVGRTPHRRGKLFQVRQRGQLLDEPLERASPLRRKMAAEGASGERRETLRQKDRGEKPLLIAITFQCVSCVQAVRFRQFLAKFDRLSSLFFPCKHFLRGTFNVNRPNS